MPERVVQRAARVLATLEQRGAREQQRTAVEQVAREDGASGQALGRVETGPSPTPRAVPWSSPLVERLDAVEVEELTPREALALVQELKLLRGRDGAAG